MVERKKRGGARKVEEDEEKDLAREGKKYQSRCWAGLKSVGGERLVDMNCQ